MAQCGDLANNESYLLKLFVLSLSGPPFEWYGTLKAGSIPDWDTMQRMFMRGFFTTHRKVSIAELSMLKQRVGESSTDFILLWRNSSMHCAQEIDQAEAVRLCQSNLRPEIGWKLVGEDLRTFV